MPKAMRVMYERPDLRIEDINPFNSLGLGRKARLIAIPTTSGTGSETSCFVVLTLSDGHKKVAFGSGELCPDIAIVDPVMSRSMPPKLRARSGFDALSHAIEAYGSTWNNEFSDAMAIKAIQMVFEYLPKACNDNDPTAQEKMHYAATIAQMASTNSEAGLAHAMAHKLGGHYKIPHGELISVFQVYSVQFVAKSCPRRYADMARAIGEKFDSDAEGATRFINDLRKLIETVGLPSSLRQLGIDENDFRSKLENLAAETFVDDSAIAIPRMPSVQELSRLFTYSFDGRDIDF